MRTVVALHLAALLSVSMGSQAATVEYQDPNLTIVAKEEPLQAVLKSIGKEMGISVTTPTDLNPMVSCAIEKQPVKQALKKLLGELSYSLKWDEKSGELVGLTILGSGTGSAVAAAPERQSPPASANVGSSPPVSSSGNQALGTPVDRSDHAAPMPEHEPPMDAVGEEREAQMAEEREAHEAEMTQRRQEEEVAQEARMKEEVQRNDDQMRAYIESQGLTMPKSQ